MRVNILTGRWGRLLPAITAEIGQALPTGQRLILLVPEQATLQAEIEMIDRLRLPGFFTLEVLSPTRLCDRVFGLAGQPALTRIDGAGKCMVMAEQLRRQEESLGFYRGAAQRKGFALAMAELLGELKRAGQTPESLNLMAQSLGGALSEKLADMALLFQGYQARLSGRFVDGEDLQNSLRERLSVSGFFNNARVWVYGFELFAAQFVSLLCEIGRLAEGLTLALTCGQDNAGDANVYAPVRATIAALEKRFLAERIPYLRRHTDAPLPGPRALQHMEAGLFAHGLHPYKGQPEGLALSLAANPYEEAEQAAAYVLSCLKDGLRLDEILLVHGALETCGEATVEILQRYGIPAFLDQKRPAANHPLFAALLAVLRVVTKGWRAEHVMDWLKSGLSELTDEEISLLETYCQAYGIAGSRFHQPFTRGEEGEMEAAEPIRIKAVAPLMALQKGLREARDADASIRAVWHFVEGQRWAAQTESLRDRLAGRGMATEAADCNQAWTRLLALLDQLHALQDGARVPMRLILPMLEAGIEGMELAGLPPEQGRLVVGKLGRLKPWRCRALLVLGLTDGALVQDSEGLLTDEELEQAEAATGSRLAMGGDMLAQLSRMNLLDTLASPSERLRISYSLTDLGGDPKRPASVIHTLRRLFPELILTGGVLGAKVNGLDAPLYSPGALLNAMGAKLRESRDTALDPAWNEAVAALLRHPDWAAKAQRVIASLKKPALREPLPEQTVRKLFSRARESVTRLETFAACPYRHFIRYGLRPQESKGYEATRDQFGNFYHKVMENFAKEAATCEGWPHWTREQVDSLCQQVMEPLTAAWAEGPLGDNAKQRAVGRRVIRTARRAAWTFTQQMRHCRFDIQTVEARFGPQEAIPPIIINFPHGGQVALEGRIDRVDLWEDDYGLYLRVLDYKSGETGFDPTRVYHGLQLQLMLYLAAALQAYPEAKPAAALYFQLREPWLTEPERLSEQIETLLMKELRLRGLVLGDVRVISAMDEGDPPLSLPWPFAQTGEIDQRSDAVTEEEMNALLRHTQRKAGELGERIAQGEMESAPAQIGDWSACDWCDYRPICLKEAKEPGRRLGKVKKRELLALVIQGD